MCLMLYVGTDRDLPVRADSHLRVETVEQSRLPVARWFSQPVIRFIGAHTGCSCGFPSIISEEPVPYFDGMWPQADERADDLRSLNALLGMLRTARATGAALELYPIGDGDEGLPPKGVIEIDLATLDAERFFFHERFMHIVG